MRPQWPTCVRASLIGSLVIVGAICSWGAALVAQRPDAYAGSRDHPAIQYSTSGVETSVARLDRDLEAGTTRLTFNDANGYLPSLLSALGVPVESQLLVFSETSAQAALIRPASPRALYFNDTTAVGWVRGATTLEVAAHDPRRGTVFYTIDQRRSAQPRLTRRDDCLLCHLTWETLGVPGWTMISTFPMSDDKNAYASGVSVDHRTPLDQRWGGWYVTGSAVPSRHFGNLPVIRPQRELALPAPKPPALTSAAGTFDTAGYLSTFSDVVALMVLGHQTHMINLLTRLGWETRVAEREGTLMQAATATRLQQAVRELVDYLLFVDEAPIPSKIEGSSAFAEKFASLGPTDAQGRSLRQLDLAKRLLRFPCSYMIYSPAFDALPASALDAVYQRMWTILSGQETDTIYAHVTRADRSAVVEILRETKASLPRYFQAVTR